jgi:hypothetical protein
MEKDQTNSNKEKRPLNFLLGDYRNLIVALAAALIIGLITTVIQQGKKMSALEEKVNSTKEIVINNSEKAPITENKKEVLEKAIEEIANPKETLINYIKDYQTRYVKKSTGIFDYNCFTDIDLDNFYSRGIPKEIEQKLLPDSEFLALVLSIKELSPEQWGNLKKEALKVFKPTFGEVGGAKSDGSAQSEAGQQAERKVGETIVGLVSELKKKDKAEIVEMFD